MKEKMLPFEFDYKQNRIEFRGQIFYTLLYFKNVWYTSHRRDVTQILFVFESDARIPESYRLRMGLVRQRRRGMKATYCCFFECGSFS